MNRVLVSGRNSRTSGAPATHGASSRHRVELSPTVAQDAEGSGSRDFAAGAPRHPALV